MEQLQTERGCFKSRGEEQIARMLDRWGIPYGYERAVAVMDRGKVRIWYPDFVLDELGVLIEYCGRADDPVYAEGMLRKERVYRENSLTTIMLTPEDLKGNWSQRVLDRIEAILEGRLDALRAVRRERGTWRQSSMSGVYASRCLGLPVIAPTSTV